MLHCSCAAHSHTEGRPGGPVVEIHRRERVDPLPRAPRAAEHRRRRADAPGLAPVDAREHRALHAGEHRAAVPAQGEGVRRRDDDVRGVEGRGGVDQPDQREADRVRHRLQHPPRGRVRARGRVGGRAGAAGVRALKRHVERGAW
eukprot:gene5294-biopygen640